MKKFQEKKKFAEVMQSRPALVLLGIVLLAFSWSVFGLLGRMQETAKNRKIEEDKIVELQQRKENLSTNIASLKTEKGVEENIREKFGLTKDGEDVIVIVDDKNQANPTKEKQSTGFLSFFTNIFKSH